MTTHAIKFVGAAAMVLLIAVASAPVLGAKESAAAPQPALTANGAELQKRYEAMLTELRTKITEALPKIDDASRAKFMAALDAEAQAKGKLGEAEKELGKVGGAEALVGHAKGKWIGGAEQDIAAAKAKLKAATTDADRQAAQTELTAAEKNLEEGKKALVERQAALDALRKEQPRLMAEVEAAKKELARATADVLKSMAQLKVDSFITSDKFDAELAKFLVLFEATPRGLAEYAQQGSAQEQRVEQLLANDALMLQMVQADGAKEGAYGRAMEIYQSIQSASPKAKDGSLQRLALAVSLEHAVPIRQSNPVSQAGAPATVDPVKRYQHYEKAFLAGELDVNFKRHSVWDYRLVVYGDEPDETLAWGREMLRNYRPDHVNTADENWRFVAAVRTEIRYGSQDVQYDREDLQSYQNMLMNGGVCGRRAFFGRFILRAFGVPTIARPQPGHAALGRWTPKGWVVLLGAGWGAGTTHTRYTKDVDFLATTQARQDMNAYMQVKRAQWVGDVVGEKRVFGLNDKNKPGLWYSVSLYRQQAIIEASKAQTLAAVGEELGEANHSSVKYAVESATVTEADRTIVVDGKGVITIPAVASSNPTQSTGKIIFMPSNLGGKQMHLSRDGASTVEYTFDAPQAGLYALTARVVTPSWQQHLIVTANGAGESVTLDLPHTVGMWETTAPVQVKLVAGKNVLSFKHHSSGYSKGVTIRDFTLTPAK